MTGVGLIFLILGLVALFAGVYFAAWWVCAVQRNSKEGHYRLDQSDEELQDLHHKSPYAGIPLDVVDESKTYKNHLDLDSINENKPAAEDKEQEAAASAAAANAGGEDASEVVSPSAPEDSHSSKGNESPV